jgi:hypothetical protein
VMGSQTLDGSLKAQRDRGNLTGLAGTFQHQLSEKMADLWQLVTRQDQRWPATEVNTEIVPNHYRGSQPSRKPSGSPVLPQKQAKKVNSISLAAKAA